MPNRAVRPVDRQGDPLVSLPARTVTADRSRSYRRLDPDHVLVTDLDTAAWLVMNDTPVAEAVQTRPGQYEITFLDRDDRVSKLVVAFLNSEALRFANAIRSLKKALRNA